MVICVEMVIFGEILQVVDRKIKNIFFLDLLYRYCKVGVKNQRMVNLENQILELLVNIELCGNILKLFRNSIV